MFQKQCVDQHQLEMIYRINSQTTNKFKLVYAKSLCFSNFPSCNMVKF